MGGQAGGGELELELGRARAHAHTLTHTHTHTQHVAVHVGGAACFSCSCHCDRDCESCFAALIICLQAFSNQPILMLQDVSGNFIFTDLGVLVAAEFVGYVYGYECTQTWNVSSSYYPCFDSRTVYSERVVSSGGVYTFESLKLIGAPPPA